MTKKTATIIAIVLILLSILFGWQYYNCPITFNKEVTTGDVLSLLMNFGVVAILVERFTNQIVIKDDFRVYIKSKKAPLLNYKMGGKTVKGDEVNDEFKPKFYWITFGVGLLIASIGLRYLHNVVILNPECSKTFNQPEIFALADVFLSGILMSGGARLVLSIIEWFQKEK